MWVATINKLKWDQNNGRKILVDNFVVHKIVVGKIRV